MSTPRAKSLQANCLALQQLNGDNRAKIYSYMVSPRTLLKGVALSLGAPLLNRGRFALFAQSAAEYSAPPRGFGRPGTVIDMLGLLPLNYRKLTAWEADPGRFRQADFLRLKASGITVFHPAVGYTAGDLYAESLRDILGWNAFLAAHSDQFQRIESFADFQQAKMLGTIGRS